MWNVSFTTPLQPQLLFKRTVNDYPVINPLVIDIPYWIKPTVSRIPPASAQATNYFFLSVISFHPWVQGSLVALEFQTKGSNQNYKSRVRRDFRFVRMMLEKRAVNFGYLFYRGFPLLLGDYEALCELGGSYYLFMFYSVPKYLRSFRGRNFFFSTRFKCAF